MHCEKHGEPELETVATGTVVGVEPLVSVPFVELSFT